MGVRELVARGALAIASKAMVSGPGTPGYNDVLDLKDPSGWGFGSVSATGRTVTDESVMQATAVYSSLKLITETVGTLPLHVYRREERGRRKAPEHDLYSLLHTRPSFMETSVTFVERLVLSLLLWQTGYVLVDRLATGTIVSLQVVPKPCVRPVGQTRDGGLGALYDVTRDGKVQRYRFGEIIPIRGFGSVDQLEGLSVAGLHKNAFGLSLAAEEFGARFFSNSATPSGVFMIDKTLTEVQRAQLKESIQALYTGLTKSHGTAVLEAGMKYQPMSANNTDSQFIESRKFQIAEIARIYRVPLHMLMEMDRATYANAEQDSQNFLRYTLRSILVRIESALNAFLFEPDDQRRHYCQFSVEGLLRGDSAARIAYYSGMFNVGAISAAEIREKEDLPFRDGSDELRVPLNTVEATGADAAGEDTEET